MEFHEFSKIIHNHYMQMAKSPLFVANVTGDDLWAEYIAAFPEGTNPIYRTRTDHDCSCCRNFIKNLGRAVTIVDNKVQSIWSVGGLGYPYDVVAARLRELVESASIMQIFRTQESSYGKEHTLEALPGNNVKRWNHLHGQVPKESVTKEPGTEIGQAAGTVQVFRRGLEELKPEVLVTVLDLIDAKALYRGTEFRAGVASFKALQDEYLSLSKDEQLIFPWAKYQTPGARIRNTAMGTLLQDLSEGKGLEAAVKAYEVVVAPTNYKRTTALITPQMIQNALETLDNLGLRSAIDRRFAVASDVSVRDVLWTNGTVKATMKDSLAEALLSSGKMRKKDVSVEGKTIKIDDFLKDVLPNSSDMELFMKNNLQANLMSLTAPQDSDAGRIFAWDNNFAWSYHGNITDSFMRQQVQARGGSVSGVFRFTHSWNHVKRNTSLMDLHVFMPNSTVKAGNGVSDNYGRNLQRVGWNHRNHAASGGVQDVDYTHAAPAGYVPVENITFPSLDRLPDGEYVCKIHNWEFRAPTEGGFQAEIEINGVVYEYVYDKVLKHKEWVTVAVVTKRGNSLTIEHHLPCESASKPVWGINTETFVPVKLILNSPNHWEGEAGRGNKHWFFILDGVKNDEPVRGIYNEFLRPELNEHRKVFEVLGAQTMCPVTDEQLSGLGFSSTQSKSVVARITRTNGAKETFTLEF